MLRTLALLVPLVLLAPTVAAGPGWAQLCRENSDTCATALLTPSLLGCGWAGPEWRCDVLWTLDLSVTGTMCVFASSTVTGHHFLCNAAFTQTVSAFGVATYPGGTTVTERGDLCIDYRLPTMQCRTFTASITLPGSS